MSKGMVCVCAAVVLVASALFAENVLVDPAVFERERVAWEGMGVTNRQLAAEITRLESEIVRLTAIRDANKELRTRLGKMERFAAATATNSVLEWRTSDGKPFLGTLVADDGASAAFNLVRGKVLTLERGKLLPADAEFLDRLRAFTSGAPEPAKEAGDSP